MADKDPWTLTWTAVDAPKATVRLTLDEDYSLTNLRFWAYFEGSDGSGGHGGELMPQLGPSEQLEIVITSAPDRGLTNHLGPNGWRHHELLPVTSTMIFGTISTDLATGAEIAKAFSWSGAKRTKGEPPVELGQVESMGFYKRWLADRPDFRMPSHEGTSIAYKEDDDLELNQEEHKKALADQGLYQPEGYLQSISVSGYRGFNQVQTLDLAVPNGKPGSGLTIVVGANNSGKSALWESFDAMSRISTQEASFSETRRNSFSEQGVSIGLTWCSGESLTISTRDRHGSRATACWGNGAEFKQGNATFDSPVVAVPGRRQFRPYFPRHENNARNWASQTMAYSRTELREGFAGRLIALDKQQGSERSEFDKTLSELLGFELSWSIDSRDDDSGQDHYVKIRPSANVSHSTEGAGEGVVSLMFIVDALRDLEKGTLVAIDEPELSLHPEAIRGLRNKLSEASRDRQVVIFTHSPLMVDWQDVENGARVARIHKVEGASRILQPSRAILEEVWGLSKGWHNPHTLGTDANEALFLRDGIVVVEGQEDVKLLPNIAQELGVEIPGTFFGWGASGHGNIPKIVGLLQGLGFEKVVGLFDSGEAERKNFSKSEKIAPEYLYIQIPAHDIRDKEEYEPAASKGQDGLYRKVLKKGLLDGKGVLRDEFKEQTTKILNDIQHFLEPE